MLLFLSTLAAATEDVAPSSNIPEEFSEKYSRAPLAPSANEARRLEVILTPLNLYLGTSHTSTHRLLESQAVIAFKKTCACRPDDRETKYEVLNIFLTEMNKQYDSKFAAMRAENESDGEIHKFYSHLSSMIRETGSYMNSDEFRLRTERFSTQYIESLLSEMSPVPDRRTNRHGCNIS